MPEDQVLNAWGEPVEPEDSDDLDWVDPEDRKDDDDDPDANALEGGDDLDGWQPGDDPE